MCYAGMNMEAIDALIDSENEKFTERRLMELRGGDPRDPEWVGHYYDEDDEDDEEDRKCYYCGEESCDCDML